MRCCNNGQSGDDCADVFSRRTFEVLRLDGRSGMGHRTIQLSALRPPTHSTLVAIPPDVLRALQPSGRKEFGLAMAPHANHFELRAYWDAVRRWDKSRSVSLP